MWRYNTESHGLEGMTELCWWLGLMILEVFFNFYNSLSTEDFQMLKSEKCKCEEGWKGSTSSPSGTWWLPFCSLMWYRNMGLAVLHPSTICPLSLPTTSPCPSPSLHDIDDIATPYDTGAHSHHVDGMLWASLTFPDKTWHAFKLVSTHSVPGNEGRCRNSVMKNVK